MNVRIGLSLFVAPLLAVLAAGPASGTDAGLSFLRQPMGASDFRLADSTYDDVPAGQTDFTLAHFSIRRDKAAGIVPLLKLARSLNPDLRIMGSPWSAPGWMKAGYSSGDASGKTDRRLYGGTLNDADPRVVSAYGAYFAAYVRAYRAEGIEVNFVTPQNEPYFGPTDYPSTELSPGQQAKLVASIGQTFAAAGIGAKIVVLDHNWDDAVAHGAVTAKLTTLLGQPVDAPDAAPADRPASARYVGGIAFHGYGGDPSAQLVVHAAYPDRPLFFTEQTATAGSNFAGDLMYDMRTLVVGGTRRFASTVVKFNLALDPAGGPKLAGGFDRGRGVVTVSAADPTLAGVTYNEEYYALGHLAKFVRPGAVRIGSDSDHTAAFANPDGTVAVLAYNDRPFRADGSTAEPFSFAVGGRSFAYPIPAQAVASFTWSATDKPVAVYLTTTGAEGSPLKRLERQPDVVFRDDSAR